MAPKKSPHRKDLVAWIFVVLLSIVTAKKNGGDYAGIHVKCTPNYMQLMLETVHYEKIDPTSMHLTDSNCKTSFYNDTVMVIRAPLGGCGTKSAVRGILISFSNEVYAELKGSSSIAREPAYQFRLRCLYYTTAKISLHSFKPETKIIIDPPVGLGTFEFETSMFQTDKYINRYTQFPVKVHIGESIYLQVRVQTNATGLSLLLDNCRATPSPDPNDTQSHSLIKDGCPVDQYLNYKNSDFAFQRFSFQAFQIENAQVMYLHCDVYVCAKDTNSSRCSEGCTQNSGGSRRRRDDTIQSEKERKGVTSLGPVKIVLDRLEPPDAGEIRSHSTLVIFEKSAVIMTFALACLLLM